MDAGLLDLDKGEFLNTLSGAREGVARAIMRGHIRARPVAEPHRLNVRPENKMVVERFRQANQRLRGAIRAVRAFQAASRAASLADKSKKK